MLLLALAHGARAADGPPANAEAVAGEAAPPAIAPDPAVSLAAVYTGDHWSALAGGIAHGSAYLDDLDLQAKFNGGAMGLPGVTGWLYLLYNNGSEFAGPYVGNLQGISNIEAVRATRLYEAWLEVPAPGGGSLRGGLYNLNTEFDANEVGALFLAPEHGIGTELAHSGVTGPSIFPVAGLALRYRREWGERRVQVALLDAVPGDAQDASRTYVHLGDGTLAIGELGGAAGGVKFALGGWRYSRALPDQQATDAQGQPLMRAGRGGAYALASHSFWSQEAAGRDLSAFLRYGIADGDVYQTRYYLGAGVVATGPFASRPTDRLGLAVGIAGNGDTYRQVAAAAGTPADAAETHLELSYRAVLDAHWFVQPDLQYVINPGTDPSLQDAWVFGLRFQVALAFDP